MFRNALPIIKTKFLNLDSATLDEFLEEYGKIYNEYREEYAKNTYPKWKSGITRMSDQTLTRVVGLIPFYLDYDDIYNILQILVKQHAISKSSHTIEINLKDPYVGINNLKVLLRTNIPKNDLLAYLPKEIMEVADWLYSDHITLARKILAETEFERLQNLDRQSEKELQLIIQTILNNKNKSHYYYNVEMSAFHLHIKAFHPSFCIIATTLFGANALETIQLRIWRDTFLFKYTVGKKFIEWYYQNGQQLANLINSSYILKISFYYIIKLFVLILAFKNTIKRKQ